MICFLGFLSDTLHRTLPRLPMFALSTLSLIVVLQIVIVGAAAALALAGVFQFVIGRESPGNQKMQAIAAKIRAGAMAFLGREYRLIGIFIVIAAALLFVFLDTGFANMRAGLWGEPWTAMSFVAGAVCSLLAGFIGMRSATAANVRTASAAQKGLAGALRIAFLSGATMGLAVVGLALLGFAGVLLVLLTEGGMSLPAAMEAATGFTFGASSVAMFARVGGGIYTKAADVGGDLVGKIEAGIPEDDPRNPAVIADNVGDNVGDVAGMGADLFESYVGAILATMIVGLSVSIEGEGDALVIYPLLLALVGAVASVLGMLVVRASTPKKVQPALKSGMLLASALFLVGAFFLSQAMLPAERAMGIFIGVAAGLLAGVAIGLLTEYYTSHSYRPVRSLADASKTGPATVLIEGLALGYLSVALPILCIGVAIAVAYVFAGMYGIAVGSVGMLATLAMVLAIDAFGPVADNAGGIAEMSHLPSQVRDRTDALDAAGNTTAAIGKGFAFGMGGLMCLALFTAYKEKAGIVSVDVTNPPVLIAVLLGAMIPFLFSSLTMRAVGRAAMAIIEEVRRQFRQIKGLMEGKAEGDPARCVAIATDAAIREMVAPGLLAVCSPIVVGLLLGKEALGGLLVGTLASSILLGMSMANSGGAWDNAKKYIEQGHLGGKKSDCHKAAVVGDTVGDPFKDTSGPSLNILIKLMTIVAVLTAGLYSVGGILG
ncbi:MAG: membrane-bound proton-translocating pyrophosphatase [Candidatus Peregrinibacteria bacterium Gr01-1014_25]|nr:MAG: membrane-bound proton-translocating pyrophosphatase [Candidatus Peregrinibacteria bacterium Gr01-1014_25]